MSFYLCRCTVTVVFSNGHCAVTVRSLYGHCTVTVIFSHSALDAVFYTATSQRKCLRATLRHLLLPPSSKCPPFASCKRLHRRAMSATLSSMKLVGKRIAVRRRRPRYSYLVSWRVLSHLPKEG